MNSGVPLLEVQDLTKRFGGVVAARGVTFKLERGEMLALIGPNGAGKSTTFNMVGGQTRPDAGHVRLDGIDITGHTPQSIVKAGAGRTFQIAQTFVSMTVAENVGVALHAAAGRSLDMLSRAREALRAEAVGLLDVVGMADSADRPVRTLAYGDIKRVELAIALASKPKLLLMDEPTAGMAPKERSALMALTQRLARERNLGVLFTEHDMDAVFGYADRILVLVRGEIIARGRPNDIRSDARVREVYLGDLGAAAAAAATAQSAQEGRTTNP
ncbi:MAG TPA: ABC transporter ATP-binding protein [Hyphomicrobiaceae bacterium]|nr:ABC transporter ATP-binding protein [Hyphomicrobiaceae bacterium]